MNKSSRPVCIAILTCSSTIAVSQATTAPGSAESKAKSSKMTEKAGDADKAMAPAGLIDRLPPDGTWGRFEGESTLSGQCKNITITIASVGKATVQGQSCRWIELAFEESGHLLIWKLLIPEKYLQRDRKILDHALSIWHRKDEQEPVNITGMGAEYEFGPLVFIMTGPDQEIRPLAPQLIETKLGRFECAGWTGHQLTKSDKPQIDTTYQQWVHEKAPFGVLRAEMEYAIKFEDRVVQAQTSITLAELGTHASSQISTADLSIEQLSARPFAPAAGWQWFLSPQGCAWSILATRGIILSVAKEAGVFRLTLAHPRSHGEDARYRPVAFGPDHRRYELRTTGGASTGDISLANFVLDSEVLAVDQVKYLGIEKLTPQEYKEPPSLVGKALPELEDVKTEFTREQAKGKAILVCFWDMNQRPSRHTVTELVKKTQELREQGVVVVCVHASKVDPNTLDKWAKDNNVPFAVGMIQANEEKTRFAWGVKSLPWLILADRKHIVTAEGFGIEELDDKIEVIENSKK